LISTIAHDSAIAPPGDEHGTGGAHTAVAPGDIATLLALISTACTFALIWHMWPLAVASFIALIGAAIIHTFNYERDYYVPAEEVARVEGERTHLLAAHG
jgi:hypothetical protein